MVAVVVLFAAGVSVGDILRWGGLPTALTLAFLNPTVQEFGRRQAKLSVVAVEANGDGRVAAPALRPWLVDADRVVANELADARETLSVMGRATNMWLHPGDPFAMRPSEADHARAREAFEEQLPDFEAGLRGWLAAYSTAAKARSQIFDLTLRLTNKRGGAHADLVTIVLDLPSTISVAEDRPEMQTPPERPCYQSPKPRPLFSDWSKVGPLLPPISRDFPVIVPRAQPREPTWKIADGGRRLEAVACEVHAERSLVIGEPLLLLAGCAGQHEVRWTAYTKSARHAARGTITLVVPPSPDRPAFGRLNGITSYSDIVIVDDDGEVVHPVRETDPPLKPPVVEDAGDLLDDIRQASAFMQWRALGLDPADDGPECSEVVRVARPVAHNVSGLTRAGRH
jgi:hypothetical protein